MIFEEHCEESEKLFGNKWEAVHKWLDEFAGKPGIGMMHRRFRHHQEGLKDVEKIFGADAVAAARQHILSDLEQEGWEEGSDPFPQNEWDYVRMGLY